MFDNVVVVVLFCCFVFQMCRLHLSLCMHQGGYPGEYMVPHFLTCGMVYVIIPSSHFFPIGENLSKQQIKTW